MQIVGTAVRFVLLLLFGLATLISHDVAIAQDYPSKPVTIIVPYAAGGTTDVVARLMAQALTAELKQPFIVENRPGGGGLNGLEQASRAAPDGYTLTVPSTGPATISPVLFKSRNFDPLVRLEPIALLASTPVVLVVRKGLGVNSVQELIALSKAKPGSLNMASAGTGSLEHLVGEYFQTRLGIKWTHIPFTGSAPALMELVAKRMDVTFDVVPVTAPLIKAGRITALAVATSKRSNELPDVVPLKDLGIDGFDFSGWHAMLAPKGVPPAIVSRINKVINEALQKPEIRQKLASLGLTPDGGTPERLAERMRRELANWTEIVRSANVATQ